MLQVDDAPSRRREAGAQVDRERGPQRAALFFVSRQPRSGASRRGSWRLQHAWWGDDGDPARGADTRKRGLDCRIPRTSSIFFAAGVTGAFLPRCSRVAGWQGTVRRSGEFGGD